MSNVIAFLERMGQDAQLRHASQSEVNSALARAQINPELKAAILAKNQQQLEALLGSSNVCCMVSAEVGDEDEPCFEQYA